MRTDEVSREDAILFMDMVGSAKSPNLDHQPFQNKPYYKELDIPFSDERRRFLEVYDKTKHILTEREQEILDAIYGVNKPRVTLKKAGKLYGITPERVRQILYKTERKIVAELFDH